MGNRVRPIFSVPLPAAVPVLFPDFRSIKYEELSRIYVDWLLHFEFVPSPFALPLSPFPPLSSVQSNRRFAWLAAYSVKPN